MSIRVNLLVAASAIALAAAGPAFAGDKEGKEMDHGKKFETMDADGNGSLSMDEVKAHYEKKGKDTAGLDEKFGEVDADDDGAITREEWDAAHAKKEEKKEGEE